MVKEIRGHRIDGRYSKPVPDKGISDSGKYAKKKGVFGIRQSIWKQCSRALGYLKLKPKGEIYTVGDKLNRFFVRVSKGRSEQASLSQQRFESAISKKSAEFAQSVDLQQFDGEAFIQSVRGVYQEANHTWQEEFPNDEGLGPDRFVAYMKEGALLPEAIDAGRSEILLKLIETSFEIGRTGEDLNAIWKDWQIVTSVMEEIAEVDISENGLSSQTAKDLNRADYIFERADGSFLVLKKCRLAQSKNEPDPKSQTEQMSAEKAKEHIDAWAQGEKLDTAFFEQALSIANQTLFAINMDIVKTLGESTVTPAGGDVILEYTIKKDENGGLILEANNMRKNFSFVSDFQTNDIIECNAGSTFSQSVHLRFSQGPDNAFRVDYLSSNYDVQYTPVE